MPKKTKEMKDKMSMQIECQAHPVDTVLVRNQAIIQALDEVVATFRLV
jgi:hypothetical protein